MAKTIVISYIIVSDSSVHEKHERDFTKIFTSTEIVYDFKIAAYNSNCPLSIDLILTIQSKINFNYLFIFIFAGNYFKLIAIINIIITNEMLLYPLLLKIDPKLKYNLTHFIYVLDKYNFYNELFLFLY